MTRKFVLPGVTPSQNRWDKMHWAERHLLRNEWFFTVLAVAGRRSPPERLPARVSIVRVARRLIDPQNVGGPVKPILDAFVEYGHLRGDGPKDVIEFTTGQRKCGRESECMEVTIRTPR